MRARSSGESVLKRPARAIHFCLREASMPGQSRSSGASASRCAGVSACQRTPSSRTSRGGANGGRRRGARGACAAACAVHTQRQRRQSDPQPRRAGRLREAGRGLGMSARASSPLDSFVRGCLQELRETGIAIGVDRQVVAEQGFVDLGGDRDLGAVVCQSWISTRPPTRATSGSTEAKRSHQRDWLKPAIAAPEAVTPRPWRASRGRAAHDLERPFARETEPLRDVGRDPLGAFAQAGGDAARKARLRIASRAASGAWTCCHSSWS